jgi:hypothetical protein
MYRTLNADKIIATLAQLQARIDERFPGAGLAKVCAELAGIARESDARVTAIRKPRLGLRISVVLFLVASLWLLFTISSYLDFEKTTADNIYSVLQGIDAALNIVVLMGAAALFLFAAEERGKRRRALAAIHELRSVIHVIDMHQLTKDPTSATAVSVPTPSSPRRTLTPYELSRYLDYCSELLSLAAKVAAIYSQGLPDPVIVDAVSDIERLTSNLSAKVWQKIAMIERDAAHAAGLPLRAFESAVATPALSAPPAVKPKP